MFFEQKFNLGQLPSHLNRTDTSRYKVTKEEGKRGVC